MILLLMASAALGVTASVAATECGSERWAIKTLKDRAANDIDFDARRVTVDHLRNLNNPGVGSDDPRTRPVEFTTYTVRAKLKVTKEEEDSDYHLVIAQPGHKRHTMIVEFPHPGCTHHSLKRHAMRRARNRLESACGPIGSSDFQRLSGVARITGVGFWDIDHGQTGIAPNAIELHPVLRFKMLRGSC
jgi:hypothetical protein